MVSSRNKEEEEEEKLAQMVIIVDPVCERAKGRCPLYSYNLRDAT